MPKHPQHPHLFALSFDGNEPCAVVRAMSVSEARAFLLAEFINLERLTPDRAFWIARSGRVAAILNAKPEYAEYDDPTGDLFTPDAFAELREAGRREFAKANDLLEQLNQDAE